MAATRSICVRLSDDDIDKVEQLRQHYTTHDGIHITTADIIRLSIQHMYLMVKPPQNIKK